MTGIRIIFAIGLCLPALAQDGLIRRNNVTDSSRGVSYTFDYETRLEPPKPPLSGCCGGGMISGGNNEHRIVHDDSSHIYFGYDLSVEVLPQKNSYRVTIRPLSVGMEKIGYIADATAWSKVALPGYPEPQTVHAGETIALDLFTNPGTGQKIVEYIRFRDPARQGTNVAASGPARDFTVTDAEIKLMGPRVTVNGMVLPATEHFQGGVSGVVAWIYIPNHGRYVLSLAPYSSHGLQKAGEIRGSSLSFTIGADTIALDCNGPIAPGNAPYNLYVLYDAGWVPKAGGNRNAFLMGSADSIDLILRR